MRRELTVQEKQLIEAEFILKETARAKRGRFCRRVFWIGLIAGSVSTLLPRVGLLGLSSVALRWVWILAVMIYTGGALLPLSFSKSIDARRLLNPWEEALRNLSDGRTLTEGIALLVGPSILGIVVRSVIVIVLYVTGNLST
jgi:hypothetical protein